MRDDLALLVALAVGAYLRHKQRERRANQQQRDDDDTEAV